MTVVRRHGAASVATLLGLSLSVALAQAVAPEWSRELGLDVWNLPSLEEDLRRAGEERDGVLADEAQAVERREAANHVAARLADGAPLAPAADELAELFQNDRGFLYTLEVRLPAAPTMRHRFARHAIERVERLLKDDPARRAAVVERLEAEYAALDASPEAPRPR